jgi:hypothetical protein
MTTDHFTSAGAGAAIASPLWLPAIQGLSEVCAVVLPILGVAWLLIQITDKLLRNRKPK